MTPGDAYVDPLIARGEELERLIPTSGTDAQVLLWKAELESLKAYARSRIAHLAAYPLASTAQEESAQYLAEQESRSAHERAAAIEKAAHDVWQVAKPLLWEAIKTGVTAGLAQAHIPAQLAPAVEVVRGAAEEAARVALADVTPR